MQNVETKQQPHIFVRVDDQYVRRGLSEKEKRIYLTVNAAAFVINVIAEKYSALQQELYSFDADSIKQNGKLPDNAATEINILGATESGIIVKAWDVLDWLDRLRKVLGGLAGVPKGENWKQSLRKSLESAEKVRNKIQHFDVTLNEILRKTYPPMGALLAGFPSEGHLHMRILVSTPARFASDDSIAIAIPAFPGVLSHADGIYLSVADEVACLSEMAKAVWDAREKFSAYIKERYQFEWPASNVSVIKKKVAIRSKNADATGE